MTERRDNGWGRIVGVAAAAFILGRISAGQPDPALPAPVAETAPIVSAPTVSAPTEVAPAEPTGVREHVPAEVPETAWEGDGDTVNVPAAAASNSRFSCSGKHLCRQMNSCEEANFYLDQCGVGRLDGDGDGVPCESIC